MITVQPSRVRSPNRVASQSDKRPSAQTQTYAAPIGGWVTNQNPALQQASTAIVLENFWPTSTGIIPRGGSVLKATIPGAIESLFEHRASGAFFAADTGNIYQFGAATPDGTALSSVLSGQSSGQYIAQETQTDGGSFLTVVNGADAALTFDGAAWSVAAITGVDTSTLSHIWAYGNRQFFVQSGTMNAYYLGTNSISGAAQKLPLSGVFRKGGSLLFGAAWSSDSGAGMDDRCVFVTDQGEFAVYHGDPASAATWSFDGVFDLGEPLGQRAAMSVGGDLLIATKAGLIPLSAAVQKDVAELKLSAASNPIEPDWREAANLSGFGDQWRIAKWANQNMALVVPPANISDIASLFAVNLETRAWTKFTGWPASDISVLGDRLYFGTAGGEVFQANTGGQDNGMPFVCKACFAFDMLGGANHKIAQLGRGTFRHATPFEAQFSVAADYRPEFPSAPNAKYFEGGQVEGYWDVIDWDQSHWASAASDLQVSHKWNSVNGQGHAFGVQVQMTSGAPYRLLSELISVDLVYTAGVVVT